MEITTQQKKHIETTAKQMALGEVLTEWHEGITYDDMCYEEVFDSYYNDEEFIVYEMYEDLNSDELLDKITSFKEQFERQLTEFTQGL